MVIPGKSWKNKEALISILTWVFLTLNVIIPCSRYTPRSHKMPYFSDFLFFHTLIKCKLFLQKYNLFVLYLLTPFKCCDTLYLTIDLAPLGLPWSLEGLPRTRHEHSQLNQQRPCVILGNRTTIAFLGYTMANALCQARANHIATHGNIAMMESNGMESVQHLPNLNVGNGKG